MIAENTCQSAMCSDVLTDSVNLLNFQGQAQKVLASWRKERVFPDTVTASCAASLGLPSPDSTPALGSAPTKLTEATLVVAVPGADGAPASPANSLFSEPSAGSIDAAVLDAFPPKTVASANIEPLPRSSSSAKL